MPAPAPRPAGREARKHGLFLGSHLPAGTQGSAVRWERTLACFPIRGAGAAGSRRRGEHFRVRRRRRGPSPRHPPRRRARCCPSWPFAGPPGRSPEHEKLEPRKATRRPKDKVSVPKFDRVPWLSDASLRNKPLLLSLPKRYPHASATFLISYKKDTNLPSLFQVPDDSFQARRKPDNPMLVRNRQLCAACWEMRTAQPRTSKDPDAQTLSFEAFMSRKMKRLQPPKTQTAPESAPGDSSAESVRHRLPIVGPRTAVFCGLLSHPLGAVPATQLSSMPRGKPAGKTAWQ